MLISNLKFCCEKRMILSIIQVEIWLIFLMSHNELNYLGGSSPCEPKLERQSQQMTLLD